MSTACSFKVITATDDNFRESFFAGDWVDLVGFRGHDFPERIFNVLDHGAQTGGVLPATVAFQTALDACHAAGGGIVHVPAGRYLIGSIFVRGDTHLRFAEGVELLASMDLPDYPEIDTRVAGIGIMWPSALINVIDAANVRISGPAVIQGRGRTWWARFHSLLPIYTDLGLRWVLDYDVKRPRMMLVQNSSNVRVSDLTFKEAPFWTMQVLFSRHVTVDHVVVHNRTEVHAPSSDGINVDSSEYVLVEHCDVSAHDDNYCVKAGRDADGLSVNRPTLYVIFRHNIAREGSGLIVFGSETSGGASHIHVHDMRAIGTTRGVRFKSATTRGGVLENILIEDIHIEGTPFVFEFIMGWNPAYSYSTLPEGFDESTVPAHWRTLLLPVEPPERGLTQVHDVHIARLTTGEKCWKAFYVEGYENLPLSGFTFEHVNVTTETAGEIKNARDWIFLDSIFRFTDGAAPKLTNTSGISFEQ